MAIDPNKPDGGAVQEITTPTFAGITPNYSEDLPEMGTLSFVDDQQDKPGQFSLFDTGAPNTAIVDPDTLAKKVDKFSFALGKDFSKEQVKETLSNGQEASLRAKAAAGEDLKDEELRSHIISEKLTSGLPEDPREQSVLYTDLKALNAFRPSNNPSTIVEKLYAQNYVRKMSEAGPEGNLMEREIAAIGDKQVLADRKQRLEETPEKKLTALADISEQAVMRQEVFKNHLERVEKIAHDQPWVGNDGGWVADFAKNAMPFYTWVKTFNAAARVPGLQLQGDNMAEQIETLAHMPPGEIDRILDQKITNGLAKDNPQLAQYFMNALVSYSGTERFFDNATSALDLGGAVSSVGKGLLAKGAEALTKKGIQKTILGEDLHGAFKDFVLANHNPNATPADKLAAVGDIQNSAKSRILSVASQIVQNNPTLNLSPQQVVGTLSSIFNPTTATANGTSLSAKQTANLASHLIMSNARLQTLLQQQVKVARLPEEALQKAFDIAEDEFKQTQVHVNQGVANAQFQHITDVKKVRPEETRANIGSVVFTMAKPDGSAFRNWNELTNWAVNQYGLNLGDFAGERIGNSYYIKVERAIDETRDEVRKHLISTNNKTPVHKYLPGFVAKRLGAQERVSEFQQGNRLAAVHGQQQLQQIVQDLTKGIKLKGDSREAVVRVMEADRSRMPPVPSGPNAKPPLPGYFLQNVAEFENEFRRLNGRLPDDHETTAYFTAINANRIEWIFNNDNMRKQLTRMGAKRTLLKTKITDPKTGLTTFGETSDFYARKVDTMDLVADPTANVVVYEQGKPHKITKVSEWVNKPKDIENLKNQGYHILHTFNPSRKPGFEVFGEDQGVTYIITKDMEMREIESHPIKFREGWHSIYDFPVYVKQPKIRQFNINGEKHHIFEGDVTHVGAHSEAEGRRIADAMNQARLMAFHGAPGNLQDFLDKNLPYSERQFRDLFTGTDPYFDLNHEFKVVADGETTTDRFASEYRQRLSNFTDTIRSPLNLMNQIDKKFYGARDEDLHFIKEGKGSQSNPVFSLQKAEKIDPYASISIGLTSMMRNAFMADYRIQAVESWLKEFGDLMIVRNDAELYSDAVRHVYNEGIWKELKHSDDIERVKAGEGARQAIVEFLGHPSPLLMDLDSIHMKMMNKVYEKTGQKGTDVARLVNEKMIATIGDPVKALKALTFHRSVGFFNSFHWFQNLMTMSYAVAASPRYGSSGSVAGVLSRFLHYNSQPAVVDRMASIAHSFGYDKAVFKEWLSEYKKTGRNIIEGDHALRNDFNDPSVFRTTTQEFLDKSLFLFKGGDRTTRAAAHATAFLEWRAANPGKQLTAEIRNQILARSDMYTTQMTRASAASWQMGVFSPVTQFLTFPARLMEMMWSGREGSNALTRGEKARILLLNSALYGMPVGVLGTSTGFVYGSAWEDVRRYLLENKDELGVDPDGPWVQGLTNGVYSVASSIVFGHGSTLGPQLGPGGGGEVDRIRKALWGAAFGDTKEESQVDLVDLLLGASSRTTSSIVKNTTPLLSDLGDIISGKQKFSGDVLAADMNQLFKTIKTWDQTTKLFVGLSNHALFSTTGEKLGEANGWDATLYAIFGAKPQHIADAEIQRKITKDRTKMIEEQLLPQLRDFTKRWADAVWERGSTDTEAQAWETKMRIVYNTMSPDERVKYSRKIINDDKSLHEKMLNRYPAYERQMQQIIKEQ